MLTRILCVLMGIGLVGAFVGCEDRTDRDAGRKVAEETDVDEGLFGDTQIEKKEVYEKNGKYETREKETTIDSDGNIEKQETEVEGGTGVDVEGGPEGIDVDVRTKD